MFLKKPCHLQLSCSVRVACFCILELGAICHSHEMIMFLQILVKLPSETSSQVLLFNRFTLHSGVISFPIAFATHFRLKFFSFYRTDKAMYMKQTGLFFCWFGLDQNNGCKLRQNYFKPIWFRLICFLWFWKYFLIIFILVVFKNLDEILWSI